MPGLQTLTVITAALVLAGCQTLSQSPVQSEQASTEWLADQTLVNQPNTSAELPSIEKKPLPVGAIVEIDASFIDFASRGY